MSTLETAVDRLRGRRVLVIGDVITDVYLEGKITRISREAPVLILEYTGETVVLGGASNAAANIQSLGGQALLAGLIGDDPAGLATKDLTAGCGIETSGLFIEPGRMSCTKTRILASGEHTVKQQMLRVDRLPKAGKSQGAAASFLTYLSATIPTVDAVVLSDYGLNTLPDGIYPQALALAKAAGRPVIADSRYRILDFAGATLLTPNVAEAEEAAGRLFQDEEDLVQAGWSLLARMSPQALLITRGPDGMSLFEPGGQVTHIPATNRLEVFDVSGAGDTVVATVALGLAAGLGMQVSARLANYAAGVVVHKIGTATVSPEELSATIRKAAADRMA